MSNLELADAVGLTPAPCLRRVRRLTEDGVITGYRAAVDPQRVGRGFTVVVAVDIRATTRAMVEEFEATVVGYEEVVDARRLFGRPDYLVTVAVADVGPTSRSCWRS